MQDFEVCTPLSKNPPSNQKFFYIICGEMSIALFEVGDTAGNQIFALIACDI